MKKMTLVKVKGALRLYLREQPHRCGRYVVTHADGRVLEEFRRMQPAVLWMKAQPESAVPKVLCDGAVCDACLQILDVGDAGTSTPEGKFVCEKCL